MKSDGPAMVLLERPVVMGFDPSTLGRALRAGRFRAKLPALAALRDVYGDLTERDEAAALLRGFAAYIPVRED